MMCSPRLTSVFDLLQRLQSVIKLAMILSHYSRLFSTLEHCCASLAIKIRREYLLNGCFQLRCFSKRDTCTRMVAAYKFPYYLFSSASSARCSGGASVIGDTQTDEIQSIKGHVLRGLLPTMSSQALFFPEYWTLT